jgi:hypothetical protein
MTLEEVRERNDELRRFKARVIMTPLVWSLPAQLRGQALYQMAQFNTFDDESDHSEGVFFFKGFAWHWYVTEFAGDLHVVLDALELAET